MAQQLSIIAMIDMKAALEAGTMEGNYYLFDNNSFAGSVGQGTPDLVTAMLSAQVLNWLTYPIALLDEHLPMPIVTNIGGPAVEQRIMVPSEYDSPDLFSEGRYWSGTIIPGKAGVFEYTLEIGIFHTSQSRERHRHRKLPAPMTITSALKILPTNDSPTAHGERLMTRITSRGRP